MQFCQVFGNISTTDPLLRELFDDPKFRNSTMEEISSSTPGLLTPPLLENPADISIQSIIMHKTPQCPSFVEKIDSCTQTDQTSYCSDDCCSPLTSMSSNSLINGYSPHSHNQQQQNNDLSQVSLDPFPSFESSLLDDCELVDSSTFSPSAQQIMFDSNECADLFHLIQ
jgi:hypothetical protein